MGCKGKGERITMKEVIAQEGRGMQSKGELGISGR
jgi:hypothetical protein